MGFDQALFGFLPVDDLPDVLKVLRSGVLVVQVVGVLPNVDADDGHEVGADVRNWVLVECFTVGENIGALVVHEPAPAGALNAGSALVERGDERVQGAPAGDEGVVERAALG